MDASQRALQVLPVEQVVIRPRSREFGATVHEGIDKGLSSLCLFSIMPSGSRRRGPNVQRENLGVRMEVRMKKTGILLIALLMLILTTAPIAFS